MRKLLLTLAGLFFYCVPSQAQLQPVEHTFPFSPTNVGVASFVHHGKKFMTVESTNLIIKFYNLDYTPWKTLDLNALETYFNADYTNFSIQHLSDNLFDTDTSMEMIVALTDANSQVPHLFLINEEMELLHNFGPQNHGNSIVFFDGNYHLMVSNQPNMSWPLYQTSVYPLPGYLPCEECTENVDPLKAPNTNGISGSFMMVSDPVPNPSDGSVTISYSLPGKADGELVFYNTSGQEVNRVKAASSTTSVQVSKKGLPAGMYYYYLYSDGKKSVGNKMMVL